ncbi:hypothetical protein MSAR_46590 [Mycolicibacterium sarraceniae]|uniref:Thiamine pyrophosphate enzyme N-terminal TPP-binding domain-containing protein n=1 Tax=Mycolicibacterium sarraceniae TaxID=1534348 RepID=A0A7I7SXT9_9MYCO|nr:hypothetical protein MSAR_46590 [Mycolicibacterium sarraceniae]
MAHTAVAYARQRDRLEAWAVTASVGPGSTNMLTAANALAAEADVVIGIGTR